MLHEIFKGMDNASEAINENFKQLGLEYGSEELGEWIRHSNSGWQISVQKRKYSIESQTNFTTPIINFKEVFFVSLIVSGDESYRSYNDVNNIETAYKDSTKQIVMRNKTSQYESTGDFETSIIIIGRFE